MALVRKIALSLLLAATAGVLLLAAWELWNYREWATFTPRDSSFSADDRARLLGERLDLISKRAGDMELLVLILLGTSGLYALVFVTASYFSTANFNRQTEQTVRLMQDRIGLAMGDLRELQEATEQKLAQAPQSITPTPVMVTPEPEPEPTIVVKAEAEATLATIPERDLAQMASEIHYELACRAASAGDFHRAMRELRAAFEHESKSLDQRLAADIEEGGPLYQLAGTPPFDQAITDLLLNMSIGIG